MWVCNKYLLKFWRLFGCLPFRIESKGKNATIAGRSKAWSCYCLFLICVHTGFFIFTVCYYQVLRTRKDIADASSNAMYYALWLLAIICVCESLRCGDITLKFISLINRIDHFITADYTSTLFLFLPISVYSGYVFIQYARFSRYPTYLNACYDMGNLIIFSSQMNVIYKYKNINDRLISLNRTIKVVFSSKPEMSTIYKKNRETIAGGPNLPKIYWWIEDLISLANHSFGYRNLSFFLHTFMFIIFHLYYSVVDMLRDGSTLFLVQHLVFLIISFTLLIKTSSVVADVYKQQRLTEAICKKVSLNRLTKRQMELLTLFLSVIPYKCEELNCLGLFSLMPSVITTMIGTVTTYCIIITQFELSIK